jgi:MerR family transcriptional regulator, copper efflux regulator
LTVWFVFIYISNNYIKRGETIGKYYRIGELAKMLGISKRTIDYYTQLGLLNPERTISNYRLYGEEALRTLKLIEQYKKINIPLEEIKTLICGKNSDKTNMNEFLMEKHVEQISEIMHQLDMEIKEIKPILDGLNKKQKELVANRLSNQGETLAKSLLVLFN